MKFIDRLYKGYNAEYLVIGRFYAVGLEACKLTADFGLDLSVTDHKARSIDGKTSDRKAEMPYAVQVKSVQVAGEIKIVNQGKSNERKRLEYKAEFFIKKDNLAKILKDTKAFVVLVCFLKVPGKNILESHFIVWLSSDHLNELQSAGYFYEILNDNAKLKLELCYRTVPRLSREEFITKHLESKKFSQEVARLLSDELPPTLDQQKKGEPYREYFAFRHKERNKLEEIKSELLDLGEIGKDIQLFRSSEKKTSSK